MRALGASIALVVLLLAAAAFLRKPTELQPRRVAAPAPERPDELPSAPAAPPEGTTTDPEPVAPVVGDGAVSPDTIQVPSQDRMHAEVVKLLSLDPQQSQRVREVIDRHARRMMELLRAERDDAFAERKSRTMQAFMDELPSVLTVEQQIVLKGSEFWKRLNSPLGVDIR